MSEKSPLPPPHYNDGTTVTSHTMVNDVPAYPTPPQQQPFHNIHPIPAQQPPHITHPQYPSSTGPPYAGQSSYHTTQPAGTYNSQLPQNYSSNQPVNYTYNTIPISFLIWFLWHLFTTKKSPLYDPTASTLLKVTVLNDGASGPAYNNSILEAHRMHEVNSPAQMAMDNNRNKPRAICLCVFVIVFFGCCILGMIIGMIVGFA